MPIVPKSLPKVKGLLEPDEEIRFGFLTQRGVSPGIPLPFVHAFNSFAIVVATDNALVVIGCTPYTGIPRSVKYRLPRTNVMGPVNKNTKWSRINLSEPGEPAQRSTWVRRAHYAEVEAADRVAIQLGAKDPYPKAND